MNDRIHGKAIREDLERGAIDRFFKIAIFSIAFILVAFIGYAAEQQNLETFFALPQLAGTQKILYFCALAATDYKQTVDTVVTHRNYYSEINPLLGSHPSRQSIALFGVGGIASAWLISRVDHPLARLLVDSVIASEQMNVWENQYVRKSRTSLPVMLVVSRRF